MASPTESTHPDRQDPARAADDRPRRRGWRRALVWATRGLAVLLALVALGALWLTRDPTAEFVQRRGELADVELGPSVEAGGLEAQDVRLVSTSGLSLRLSVLRPAPTPDEGGGPVDLFAGGPRPLIVILGGHRTGRDAVHLVPHTRGALVAALDYPYDGDDRLKGLDAVTAVPAIRQALRDTPPAVQLALDWLLQLEEVDRRHVELVGVSLGSIFACIAGALDPRVTRVWAIHGGADNRRLLDASLEREIGSPLLRAPAAWALWILTGGAAMSPERWVAGIAPRPLVVVAAEEDERVPPALARELHAAAREPRELVWMPGGHLDRRSHEQVRDLVDRVLDRVVATAR